MLAYEDTSRIGVDLRKMLMDKYVAYAGDVAVSHDPTATPRKRIETLTEATPDASTPLALNRRKTPG